jgi:uncharacterized protein YdeI (YjbR/CyaY-like superfamily)
MSTTHGQFSVPPDFQRALRRSGLFGFFTECAYVHRAGYLGWITTSGRPATRKRRIEEAVLRLLTQRAEVLAAAGGTRRCA